MSHTGTPNNCEAAASGSSSQMREAKKKLAAAVRAFGTTLTEVFGVGPIVAATVIGEIRDVSRFADRDHFAAYNGTAPIEVSSGRRKIYRLSRRGNRRPSHAIHMAAVTQISHDSAGRSYYERKLAEGKTPTRSHKETPQDDLLTQRGFAKRPRSECWSVLIYCRTCESHCPVGSPGDGFPFVRVPGRAGCGLGPPVRPFPATDKGRPCLN